MIRHINSELKEKGNFWEDETIVCELDKSKKSFYRFSLCKKDGKEFVSIREFVANRDNELIPTKKGMTITKDNLSEFIECLKSIYKF